MTLTLYRRHKRTCPNLGKARREAQKKCNCKFWVDGVLAGREVRLSLGTRDSKKANEKVHEWESKERVIERGAAVTLADAWTSLLADLEARKLSHGQERGFKMLGQISRDVERRARTAGKKLERLRAFFRFAHDRQWVKSNPATRINPPKVSIRPTMPLTHEETVKILTACDGLQISTPIEGKLNARRLKTLVLLMRYTGMRVSDAVTLTTDRLDGNRLFLYTQKTGVPVYTVLPDSVLKVLEATPRITDTRYFWSGQGKRETVICHWQMRLKKVFDLAEVSKGQGNAISHRFRDTFAVELLLAGVPIERVSILFGASEHPRHRAALQPLGALTARATRSRCCERMEARSGSESENHRYKSGTLGEGTG